MEFVLFFDDEVLEGLDRRSWVAQLAPVLLFTVNDFGTPNVVFEGLVRGEFHFHARSELEATLRGWQGAVWLPSVEAALICDKTGELAPLLAPLVGEAPPREDPATAQALVDNAANWFLFGLNVLERGEHARALDLLSFVQRQLLLLARLDEGRTERWYIPSRKLETELSPAAYRRFVACTAPLDEGGLWRAYRHAWCWLLDLLEALQGRYGVGLATPFVAGVEARLTSAPPPALTGLQRLVADFVAAHDLEAPVAARLLDLVSEVGEVAKEALKGTGYGREAFSPTGAWSDELADALFALLCVANSTGVDLEGALAAVLGKYEARLAARGDAGSGE